MEKNKIVILVSQDKNYCERVLSILSEKDWWIISTNSFDFTCMGSKYRCLYALPQEVLKIKEEDFPRHVQIFVVYLHSSVEKLLQNMTLNEENLRDFKEYISLFKEESFVSFVNKGGCDLVLDGLLEPTIICEKIENFIQKGH